MTFSKPDLHFVHYRWETGEQPANVIYQGQPARRPFDVFNGDQVLFLINYYSAAVGGLTIQQVQIVEKKLAYQLPMDIRSEKSVFTWLMEQGHEAVSASK